MIVQAATLVASAKRLHSGGGVLVADGRIVRVLTSVRAVARAARQHGARVVDLQGGVLAPGFVNAHAHLELGTLAGRLPRGGGFAAWIRAIIEARRTMKPAAYARGVERGARRLLETGTTTTGDIASTESGALASRLGLRSVVFREVLDAWDERRTEAALLSVRRALPARRQRLEGISPHAPYTTSSDLLARISRLSRRRRMPVSVHWSETADEVEWLRSGRGAFAGVLPDSPRASGLDLLASAGLLGPGTSLVHGNHPGRGEPERLAAKRVTLIHCPGTHAFFERAPFPLGRYRRAGVSIALGTDSLGSNDDLDMRREMSLLRRSHPTLSPQDVFRMATSEGARALGLARRVGELASGAEADFVHHRLPSEDMGEVLEALTLGEGRVDAVWVSGRRVYK